MSIPGKIDRDKNLTVNQSTKTSWSVFGVTRALGHFNDDCFKAPPPPKKVSLQCLSHERRLEKPILQNFYPTGSLVLTQPSPRMLDLTWILEKENSDLSELITSCRLKSQKVYSPPQLTKESRKRKGTPSSSSKQNSKPKTWGTYGPKPRVKFGKPHRPMDFTQLFGTSESDRKLPPDLDLQRVSSIYLRFFWR